MAAGSNWECSTWAGVTLRMDDEELKALSPAGRQPGVCGFEDPWCLCTVCLEMGNACSTRADVARVEMYRVLGRLDLACCSTKGLESTREGTVHRAQRIPSERSPGEI